MTMSWAPFWLSVSELSQRRTTAFWTGVPQSPATVRVSHAIDRNISLRTSDGFRLGPQFCGCSFLRAGRFPGHVPREQPGDGTLKIGDLVRALVDHDVGAGRFWVETEGFGKAREQNNGEVRL